MRPFLERALLFQQVNPALSAPVTVRLKAKGLNNMKFTPITEEQRRAFNDDGFLIVRNALTPPQIERLIAAGDRLIESPRTDDRFSSRNNYDSFRNSIAKDEAFLELLTLDTTVPLVVQILGPRIQSITSHLIYKFPNDPGTPPTSRTPGWHRDVANTTEDLGHALIPRIELKVAYYLTDTTAPCSAVTMFARGSNHLKEPLEFPEGQTDPDTAVEPQLKAGDAVFFENRTYHAGASNLTGNTTKAIMMGYGFWWMKPMDYAVQPEWLVEKCDDIGKQLLNGLKDKDGRFVPGGIHTPLTEWCQEHGVEYRPVEF